MVYSPAVVGLVVGADEGLDVGAYEIGESDDENSRICVKHGIDQYCTVHTVIYSPAVVLAVGADGALDDVGYCDGALSFEPLSFELLLLLLLAPSSIRKYACQYSDCVI